MWYEGVCVVCWCMCGMMVYVWYEGGLRCDTRVVFGQSDICPAL